MAINPPSDIILDVARAADPAAVAEARAKLAGRSAAVGDAVFPALPPAAGAATASAKADGFRRFEAVVLQTFIQTMLPKDAGNVYGKGMAGDMWKSMMAEQLAGQMAERGGIGIADRLLADHYRVGEATIPVGPLSGGPEREEADGRQLMSSALVNQIQIRLARSLRESGESDS